jgi:hypothetical protein
MFGKSTLLRSVAVAIGMSFLAAGTACAQYARDLNVQSHGGFVPGYDGSYGGPYAPPAPYAPAPYAGNPYGSNGTYAPAPYAPAPYGSPYGSYAPYGALNVSLIPLMPSVVPVGAPIGFNIGATANGFANLYVLSASGQVQVWLENVRINAGRMISYPSSNLAIQATPPGGDDQVVLVVTRAPLPGFARGVVRTPLTLQYSHRGFWRALGQKVRALPPGTWAKAEVTVRVED